MSDSTSKRIAIVGSGISGLAALYSLRNSGHDVHLYEQDDRLGGHTNTVDWVHGKKVTKVDTGFIVLNTFTYPNFIAFLKELGVPTVETDMSFSVSRDWGKFEWSGTNLWTVFSQKSNLLSLSFYRMILDILRFNITALELLSGGEDDAVDDISIGDYLERNHYSREFRDDYLLPMTACVWSTGAEKCALEFPAVTLVRFMWNHHLLTVGKRPSWLTIPGGSKRYIDAVMTGVSPSKEHKDSKVVRVRRQQSGKCLVELEHGEKEEFDDVVLACHGDDCFNLIRTDADSLEVDILSAFKTTSNIAYLHSDLSLLPIRRKAWAAWNYLTTTSSSSKSKSTLDSSNTQVSLTYNMNILQHIPTSTFGDVLVTLNPPRSPRSSSIQGVYYYAHPLYTTASVRAQRRLPELQGHRGIYYAGAWTGYGFHEDGFTSGLNVGQKLGGSMPFEVIDAKMIRGRQKQLGLTEKLLGFILLCLGMWLDIFLTILAVMKKLVRVVPRNRGWWAIDKKRLSGRLPASFVSGEGVAGSFTSSRSLTNGRGRMLERRGRNTGTASSGSCL